MYLPNQVTGDLGVFLQNELQRLAETLNSPQTSLKLSVSYSPPTKFGEGTIVLASGAPNWDPGSGAGFYGYRGGSWRKLD
jgi:hypothetical protein